MIGIEMTNDILACQIAYAYIIYVFKHPKCHIKP